MANSETDISPPELISPVTLLLLALFVVPLIYIYTSLRTSRSPVEAMVRTLQQRFLKPLFEHQLTNPVDESQQTT
jgi:hypothetical protein